MPPSTEKLVFVLRFYEGRYHGGRDWPPSPGRLFQALVSGGATGDALPKEGVRALRALEQLPAPTLYAPETVMGTAVTFFMPNNDLDSVGGDPSRVAKIRKGKEYCPRIFSDSEPVVYVWQPPDPQSSVYQGLSLLAERLHHLGRGIDPAWAQFSVMDDAALSQITQNLEASHPTPGARDGVVLTAPCPGTLDSLIARHTSLQERFQARGTGRKQQQVFAQGARPLLRECSYGGSPQWRLFDLRTPQAGFHAWPGTAPCKLVGALQAGIGQVLADAEAKLLDAGHAPSGLPELCAAYVTGSSRTAKPRERVRLLPLPSTGHEQVNRSIRRVLVQVPSDCPMDPADLWWALGQVQPATGLSLDPAEDWGMLKHYGLGKPESHWQSVTPVVLPSAAKGLSRMESLQAAERAVLVALRHAGVRGGVTAIALQREPWAQRGAMSYSYAAGTRFSADRLWHLRLTLRRPVSGPLLIGDGRFVGLGLMERVPQVKGADRASPTRQLKVTLVLPVAGGLQPKATPVELARAFRRAVMAIWQRQIGAKRQLPSFLTGHSLVDSSPSRERHDRVSFWFLPGPAPRLLLQVPERHQRLAMEVLCKLRVLRAGRAGVLELGAPAQLSSGAMVGPSRSWRSTAPYRVTRHLKNSSAVNAVVDDVLRECSRAGLPEPEVLVLGVRSVKGVGVLADLELRFQVAVAGPFSLGRDRYMGGPFLPSGQG